MAAWDLPESARPLEGEYYVHCQDVFRRATDQNEKMLVATLRVCRSRPLRSILSAGSGSGLYELPLLRAFRAHGSPARRFVGVDPNERAGRELVRSLAVEFAGELDFEVRAERFQDFAAGETYDLVIFNHAFEYLRDDHRRWIEKAVHLLPDEGLVLIFSPLRGGINGPYAAFSLALHGHAVFFADDLHRLVREIGLGYRAERLAADCDVSALAAGSGDPDFLPLLSFLAQIDCREVPPVDLAGLADFYLSLRKPGSGTIAHPAELFIIPHEARP